MFRRRYSGGPLDLSGAPAEAAQPLGEGIVFNPASLRWQVSAVRFCSWIVGLLCLGAGVALGDRANNFGLVLPWSFIAFVAWLSFQLAASVAGAVGKIEEHLALLSIPAGKEASKAAASRSARLSALDEA
jgi:hypothetical protein